MGCFSVRAAHGKAFVYNALVLVMPDMFSVIEIKAHSAIVFCCSQLHWHVYVLSMPLLLLSCYCQLIYSCYENYQSSGERYSPSRVHLICLATASR